tara:strand:- start:794 stop:997 length:204 start_codon:yes stop_codon:yes gene_type:complete
MSCYLVQEIDGVGRFELEDGSGFLVLENCTPTPPQPGVGGPLRKGRRRRLETIDQELDWLAVVLNEV